MRFQNVEFLTKPIGRVQILTRGIIGFNGGCDV